MTAVTIKATSSVILILRFKIKADEKNLQTAESKSEITFQEQFHITAVLNIFPISRENEDEILEMCI